MNGIEFDEILKSLVKRVDKNVTRHQLSWRLDAKFSGKSFMMLHTWRLEVHFFDWARVKILDHTAIPKG
jgi:plasmid replication initiation protein